MSGENRHALHPFLVPASWAVTGNFVDPEGSRSLAAGATIVEASEEFPEILNVSVELHEVEQDLSHRPVSRSAYRLEIAGPGTVRFRMDSIALATVLLGTGVFTEKSLMLHYRSPDGRFSGFENFIAADNNRNKLTACGVFTVDGTVVKYWEVTMEKVEP